MTIINSAIEERYPPSGEREIVADTKNPAISIYGRRFYKDQTPVEYLAELLLVFVSPKGKTRTGGYRMDLDLATNRACYWPESRIALKLFAFFPTSKLETRHPVHQSTYLKALGDLKSCVAGSSEERDETVRLLQSLFSGFVGVARNRTWATHSFLPVAPALLSREVDWLHTAALRNQHLQSWDESKTHFATDRHNFMARGGELLFLQLANLFSVLDRPEVGKLQNSTGYEHLNNRCPEKIKTSIEQGLKKILKDAVGPIGQVAEFVEQSLSDLGDIDESKSAPLGWVPSSSSIEAYLFACELENICHSPVGPLEKIDLLQQLCCMQVLRSLCFQARRVEGGENRTDGFWGGYAWIVADFQAGEEASDRKRAQSTFIKIEEMLFRVLRQVGATYGDTRIKYSEADKHGFHIFRKIAKELGLVIPRKGRGQRFVLPPHLLRFLVAAVMVPGERVRLTEFYSRVFAHYGIALGDKQLVSALKWMGNEAGAKDYAVAANNSWVEEALQQGGYLMELSDAVSIVLNPGNAE
jgi:hypothetical protein